MKLLSAPRQPFVGLAVAAALGIIFGDSCPLSKSALAAIVIALVLGILLTLWRPNLSATYVIVAIAFFLLHNLQTRDTPGLRLAARMGERPRPVTVTGAIESEPKVWPNGFSNFLLKLRSIELEGQDRPVSVTWLVTWRGTALFGDELKLRGMAEPIAPPRNPGQFDMRALSRPARYSTGIICPL